MSLLKPENAYAFVGGAFVGRYAGFLPTILITGGILYLADPTLFTWDTFQNGKTVVIELVKNITG